MPRLYHYTNRSNIEGIFRDELIRARQSARRKGAIAPPTICMTDDIDPVGHGLPDGRPITDAQAGQLGAATGSPGSYLCVDFTKYRLAIDFPDGDPYLLRADDAHDGVEIIAMKIAAYYPTTMEVSNEEMSAALAKFSSGAWRVKSGTWWYLDRDLPLEAVASVDIRMDDGSYMSATVQQFYELLRSLAK